VANVPLLVASSLKAPTVALLNIEPLGSSISGNNTEEFSIFVGVSSRHHDSGASIFSKAAVGFVSTM
jgi:hypothetical protein